MEKQKRKVKPPTDEEKAFLEQLYVVILKPLQEKPTALKQFAGDCDLEHANLCRYTRDKPNARIISIRRFCESRNKPLWEVIKEAEEKLLEQKKKK